MLALSLWNRETIDPLDQFESKYHQKVLDAIDVSEVVYLSIYLLQTVDQKITYRPLGP